jgi:uncharacterized membrane-anchored protein YjiN (DUF445 family)
MSEIEQQAQLARMRTIATGLLALMAVIFVGARLLQPAHPWLSYVTAFTEAAMVGALADWFAVTALFRRPLGLPIPHTEVIPRNKDRIGESVANFLEHNFITREVLAEELKPINFAGSAALWLENSANRRAVAVQLVSGLPALVRMIEDEEVGNFLQNAGARALKNVRMGPILAELLAMLIADRRHQMLFDHLITIASDALQANRLSIRQKIHEKSPRWLPRAVDDRLFAKLIEEAENILEEMKQEDSSWRERFQQSAEEFIEKLRVSPEYEQKIAAIVGQTLSNPLFREYSQQIWRDLRDRLLQDVASPSSRTVRRLDWALGSFSHALVQDASVQDRLNTWFCEFSTDAIVNRRHAIAALVKRVIQKWDAETVSRKFELYVGKDLQYIRINGTLVGGLVGLLLHIFSLAL